MGIVVREMRVVNWLGKWPTRLSVVSVYALSDRNVRPTLEKNYDRPRVKRASTGSRDKPDRIEVDARGWVTAPSEN